MTVFQAYDIRGIYGSQIDEDLAYKIGRIFARVTGVVNVALGHDSRRYSSRLSRCLMRGLMDEGACVVDTGLVSTPALHYFQVQQAHDAAVMATASHNPPEYHGFKFFDRDGRSISYEKGLCRVAERMSEAVGKPVARGRSAKGDAVSGYIDFLADSVPPGTGTYPFRMVIDTSNGSAGKIFKQLVKRLDLNAVLLNTRPDGRFPCHSPNPLDSDSQIAVSQRIREENADLGAILDGDGDRILFLDEMGEPVESAFSAALLAEELFVEHSGFSVVHDHISSRVLSERVRNLGGTPVVSKVGYSFVHDAMFRTGASLGCEASGHLYFKIRDGFFTESSAYALIRLLNVMYKRKEPLSRLLKPLRDRYFRVPEINIPIDNEKRIIERIEKKFSAGRVDRFDGLSIAFDDFWFNVRSSNTEPLLRIRLEALDRDTALHRRDEIIALIRSEN